MIALTHYHQLTCICLRANTARYAALITFLPGVIYALNEVMVLCALGY